MTIKRIIPLLLVAFVFLTACKSKKAVTTSMDGALPKSLLWEMKVDGVEKPSYVYGTIHMIEKEDYFLPTGTLSAIEASDKMVFEIDIAEMTDMSSLFGIMNKIFMNDGVTLKDLLSEEDYKFVGEQFEEAGLPLMMLERIKPMFLSALAYTDMDAGGLTGGGDIKSYEMEFYDMATSRGMTTGGLETIDFQISVFDSIPYQEQAKMLVDALKSSDTDNDEFKIMTDMYKAQDISKMAGSITAEDSGYSDYEDILLTKRNKAWIPQMIAQAKAQPTFFAVGAGHLGGANGVIKLLMKEGVTLRPLSIAKP